MLPEDKTVEELFGRCGGYIRKGCFTSKRNIVYVRAAAEISPRDALVAGSTQDFRIIFRAGETICPGGIMKFGFPQTWSPPQVKHPRGAGYVSVEGDGEAFDVYGSRWGAIENYINVVARRRIPKGTPLHILWRKVSIQRFAQDCWTDSRNNLGVFVKHSKRKPFLPVAPRDRYTLNIIPDKPASVRVMLPSVVKVGEAFALRLSVPDQWGNLGRPPFVGKLHLRFERNAFKGLPRQIACSARHEGTLRIEEISAGKEGIFRVSVRDGSGRIRGRSNPVKVVGTEPEFRIFYGDIHAHTNVSDGTRSPDEAYRHARDVALSDLAAVTDHNSYECSDVHNPFRLQFTKKQWQQIKDAAHRYYRPGRFVTIVAQEEWLPGGGGHRNIYFYGADPPSPSHKVMPNDIWRFLEKNRLKGIVIPHHSLGGCRWDSHSPKYERLVEIYSTWGSSEYRNNPLTNPWWRGRWGKLSARDMLNRGGTVGFVGGSDNHNGAPDFSPVPSHYASLMYRGGVTAVLCKKLTRRAVMDAMWQRRCYATTGARMIVDFRINGRVMGSLLDVESGEPFRIKAEIIGTEMLKEIVIIKNGETFFRKRPNRSRSVVRVTDEPAEPGRVYYYLRATQRDDHIAWASPIWVTCRKGRRAERT